MDLKRYSLRLGLGLALVCVSGYLGSEKILALTAKMGKDTGHISPLFIAARFIPAYTLIQADDLHEQDFPKETMPPGALTSLSELENEKGQRVMLAAVGIPAGHPMTRALLIDTARSATLGSLLGYGQVAVSFEVERARGVGGWLKPGDTVSIFSGDSQRTRLLFPGLLVLAVDHERLGDSPEKKSGGENIDMMTSPVGAGGPQVITVLASAGEATALMAARATGPLSLVLRSPGDDPLWPKAN